MKDSFHIFLLLIFIPFSFSSSFLVFDLFSLLFISVFLFSSSKRANKPTGVKKVRGNRFEDFLVQKNLPDFFIKNSQGFFVSTFGDSVYFSLAFLTF
jgi:hypothetical protein